MPCLYHDDPALLRVRFQTNHGRENSASYVTIQARKTFSYQGHALVTLYAHFLCFLFIGPLFIGQNLTGEFMRKIYAAS